jgi:hypothetical protein
MYRQIRRQTGEGDIWKKGHAHTKRKRMLSHMTTDRLLYGQTFVETKKKKERIKITADNDLSKEEY